MVNKRLPAHNTLSPESLAAYRATAQRRHKKELQERQRREDRAWELARQAAVVLKERFGVTRVMVFGSLVHKNMFTLWSDVDIAAWGIQPADTFRAIGVILDLDDEIQVNLVDVNTATADLIGVIEQEGIGL